VGAGAEAATLTFMVGGAGADVEEARGLLMHMGKNVVHCGEAGTGGVAKVCNNLVLGVNMAGVAEAMALGRRLGAWSRGATGGVVEGWGVGVWGLCVCASSDSLRKRVCGL
jgi:3-hydroxyisobutyrate dehydrogenase